MTQHPNRILNALPQNIFAAVAAPPEAGGTARSATSSPRPDSRSSASTSRTAGVDFAGRRNGSRRHDRDRHGGARRRGQRHRGARRQDRDAPGHRPSRGLGSTIAPEALRSLADEFELLRTLLIRHEQVVFAQAQQSAGCNASHTVEARMCRWLLRIRDLTGSDEMELTQEFLAQMLGVRRTSVSLVANTLQQAGFIKYRRGRIRLFGY